VTEALLRVVLAVLIVLLGGSVLLLLGHGAWLAFHRARNQRLLAPARAALNHLLAGDAPADDDIAALLALPLRLRTRLVLELVPRLRGSMRARLSGIAQEIGVRDHARRGLHSRFWWTRLRAARTLTPLETDPHTFRPLLSDPHPAVRAQAVEWAGDNPDPDLITTLLALLPANSAVVRSAAEDALLRAGSAVVDPLRRFLEGSAGAAPAGTAVLPALRIARSMPQLEFVPAAMRLTQDAHPRVRMLAAELLGAVGGEAGTASLTPLLDDVEPAVRAAAATALGRLGYWPAASAVAARLRDPDWDVRLAAGMALRSLDSPGQLLLRRFRSDDDPYAADMARHTMDIPGDDVRGPA
jgi:HEAT repeat protein